jgi:hypothetical protein
MNNFYPSFLYRGGSFTSEIYRNLLFIFPSIILIGFFWIVKQECFVKSKYCSSKKQKNHGHVLHCDKRGIFGIGGWQK